MNEQPIELVRVRMIEVLPELDPFHLDTGRETRCELWLDPRDHTLGICQGWDDHTMTSDEYHRLVLSATLVNRPYAEDARDYLQGAEGQALARQVCDGFSEEWDGHNMGGRYTEAAEEAWGQLVAALEELPASDWVLWDTDDWLEPVRGEVSADTSDAELAAMARDYERVAREEHYVLTEGVLEILRGWRDDLAAEEAERLAEEQDGERA
jgi:hypothetical protein